MCFFSFLYWLPVCLAQPFKYCLLIFPCQCSMEVFPSVWLDHISLIISRKPSRSSDLHSNLNKVSLTLVLVSHEFNRSGVWSEITLDKACTVANRNFSSYSMVTNTRSNFSKVGIDMLFAQVYFLPDISNSRKFNPSIIALNRKDHQLWNQSLFFSSELLIMLKSPLSW
jgi:hypothetical protein